MSRWITPVHIDFCLITLPIRSWYLWATCLQEFLSVTICLPCINFLVELQLSELVFVLFWKFSLLIVQSLSDTTHSVFHMTQLNDVPSTGTSYPVAHLLLSFLFQIHSLESFHLQMGFPFPFLCANYLRSSLLNVRARSFLLSCT